MVPVMSLWIPILLSAVIVFIASSVMHMVLKYHKGDMKPLPREDEVRAALAKFSVPPGDYYVPYAGSTEAMKSPEYAEKLNQGPVALMTFVAPGPLGLGKSLVAWFLFSVVVSLFAGYIAGAALAPGAHYLKVFQLTGASAFMGYGLALVQNSIWYKRSAAATARGIVDGLVYGLLTAGTFGWLWPA